MAQSNINMGLELELYGFFYNPCIHESALAMQSIHYTKAGAQRAMRRHKRKKKQDWQKIVDSDEDKGSEFSYEKISPFGIHEEWWVGKVEVEA